MTDYNLKPALRWGVHATADVHQILDFIGSDAPVSAAKLIDEIDERAAHLTDHPKMGRPGRVDGTRELVVHRNYLLVYKEDPEEVRILRVLHAKQQWPS